MSSLRGILLLPALLSALLMMVGPVQAQGVNAKNLLKLARSAADNKDWPKARDYATQALQEEGGYLDAYYMRAFAYREMGEKKKAEDDFREVIRREPKFLATYGGLAEMYIKDEQWDKAEKVFGELGAQDDGAKWASYYRGVVAYQRGDMKKAEMQWKDALQKDVNFAMAAHNLGAIYLARKEYTRALASFQEAMEKDDDKAMYRFHVAWALAKTGQTAKAQDQLKRVMNENSDDQTYWLLARALDQILRKQYDTALKVLDTVTKDDPENLDAWVLVAKANLALGHFEPARVALEKAKKVDPYFAEVGELLAKIPAAKPEETPKTEGGQPAAPGTAPAPAPPAATAPPVAPAPSAAPAPPAAPAPAAAPPVRERKPNP